MEEAPLYKSFSASITNYKTASQFVDGFSNNKFFAHPLNLNPNLLNELFLFIKSKTKKHIQTYNVFDREIRMYKLEGLGNFFYRESDSSFVIYPFASKMKYLNLINSRKREFHWRDLNDLKTYEEKLVEWEDHFNKEFFEHFKIFGVTQLQADTYSRIVMHATTWIFSVARDYFRELTEFQILGFNDNKYNISTGKVSYAFEVFSRLIAFIDLKFSPYQKLQSLKFLSYHIKKLNDHFFEGTFLYQVLENEREKLFNEDVIEQIRFESKLKEQDLLMSRDTTYYQFGDSNQEKKEAQYFNTNIFKNEDTQNWFNETLDELLAFRPDGAVARAFQAKCKAIFDDKNCKRYIFKSRLPLQSYIDFLKETYKAKIKAKDKLSSGTLYEEDVRRLIKIYIENLEKA